MSRIKKILKQVQDDETNMDWSSCQSKISVNGQDQAFLTLQCIPVLVKGLIGLALAFAGVVSVIFIILGGIKYITANGDPKQAEGAQKTITFAIVGLVVILMAFFIVNIVSGATGVTCIGQIGFSCQ